METEYFIKKKKKKKLKPFSREKSIEPIQFDTISFSRLFSVSQR